jgi:Nif-specific regulatory protein
MTDVKGIFSASATLAGTLTLDQLLRVLMDTAADLTGAEAGSVLLLDKASGDLVFAVATGEGGAKLSEEHIRPGDGIAGWVAKTGKATMVNDVASDDRHASEFDRKSGFTTTSLVAVPIFQDDSVIGVLEAVNKKRGRFDQSDLTALSAFAQMASVAISNARKFERLTTQNRELREQAFGKWRLVGNSRVIKELRDIITRVAVTPTTVLITGESGTGKEVVAHEIHRLSRRTDGPFVKVSCAALPETLLESELFGHERGAFTGATDRRSGRFEVANGGTILLDEIGEISHTVQSKLLRILQEKEFERLGSTKTLTTDARLLAATNRDLRALVASGAFREDLFYRLNVVPIEVPPLREHIEDIPLLIDYFLEKLSDQFPHRIRGVEEDALRLLVAYSWPGNVRELFNILERCAVISPDDMVSVKYLPSEITGKKSYSGSEDVDLGMTLPEVEESLIRHALASCGGNVSEAARRLEISRDRFRYRLLKYNIDPSEYR